MKKVKKELTEKQKVLFQLYQLEDEIWNLQQEIKQIIENRIEKLENKFYDLHGILNEVMQITDEDREPFIE